MAAGEAPLAAGKARTGARVPLWLRLPLRRRTSATTAIAALVLATVVLAAVFAPWVAPYPPDRQQIVMRLKPPAFLEGGNWRHPLGTDALGRDVLSRLIYGARVSLVIAAVGTAFAAIAGVAVGLVAGHVGGAADGLLMGITEVALSFPFMLLALALIGVVGPGLGNVVLVIGLTGWPTYARLVRGEVLALREREFVLAARAVGATELRVAVRHVLPNLIPSVMVVATTEAATVILLESSLSFLGLGVPPSIPSWGSMLADGRPYLDTAWWLATLPGLAILVVAISINILGDHLRDRLDPTLEDE